MYEKGLGLESVCAREIRERSNPGWGMGRVVDWYLHTFEVFMQIRPAYPTPLHLDDDLGPRRLRRRDHLDADVVAVVETCRAHHGRDFVTGSVSREGTVKCVMYAILDIKRGVLRNRIQNPG